MLTTLTPGAPFTKLVIMVSDLQAAKAIRENYCLLTLILTKKLVTPNPAISIF